MINSGADGHLMPRTDMANTTVIAAQTGHIRTTNSWVLGRLLRDMDDRLDDSMKDELPHVTPGRVQSFIKSAAPRKEGSKPWEPLRISVFEVIDEPGYVHGIPHRDLVWVSGFVVIIVQLVIAIIPCAIDGEWGTFLITGFGNVLALLEGSLPQWREEKRSCPKNGGATVTITQGNGNRHAILILGKKNVGLDLEILARGTRTAQPSLFTRLSAAILAVLWIGLLITASGFKINTWCK